MLRQVLAALGTVLLVCVSVRVAAEIVTPAIPTVLTVMALVGLVALVIGILKSQR